MTAIPGSVREILEQLAASCPFRWAHEAGSPAGGNHPTSQREACALADFELRPDPDGGGFAFACRHSEGGLCAGHIALTAEAETETAG